jgi:hypothetical protein
MSAVTAIPLTVEPEAAAHVAELGMQGEFEKMLEHIRQVVPGLCRINVRLWVPEDFDDDPRVTFEGVRNSPVEWLSRIIDEWFAWVIGSFSPDVLRHFTFFTTVESAHGR